MRQNACFQWIVTFEYFYCLWTWPENQFLPENWGSSQVHHLTPDMFLIFSQVPYVYTGSFSLPHTHI